MTKEVTYGEVEGEICNRNPIGKLAHTCKGIIAEHPVENCSCHINPPCSSCTDPRGYCPECGWEAKNDSIVNDYVVNWDQKTPTYHSYHPRPLDPTKIDWRNKEHTHFSMIKEGVYPEGTTMEEVRKLVNGTFGGRFEYFNGGKFKFIAYTD